MFAHFFIFFIAIEIMIFIRLGARYHDSIDRQFMASTHLYFLIAYLFFRHVLDIIVTFCWQQAKFQVLDPVSIRFGSKNRKQILIAKTQKSVEIMVEKLTSSMIERIFGCDTPD